MQISRAILPILLGAASALPVAVHAQPAPGWQQTLQGLFTGNQNQDDALRQAYQRGYQRGRDDEARAQTSNRPRRYGAGPYGNDNGPRYGDQD